MTVEWGTRVPRMGPAGKVSYGLALVGEIPAIVVPGKTQGDNGGCGSALLHRQGSCNAATADRPGYPGSSRRPTRRGWVGIIPTQM